MKGSNTSAAGYAASGALPLAIGMIVPFIVGDRMPSALIPETIFLVILVFYFYGFFNRIDSAKPLNNRNLWAIYMSFFVVMLIGGAFNRTIASDVLAIAAVLLLAILGWAKTTSHSDIKN